MLKKLIKKATITLAAAVVMLSVAGGLRLNTGYALGDASKSDVCSSIGAAGCQSGGASVDTITKTVINVITVLAGIVTVVMVIIAGIKFATSGGDSNKVTSARNSLMYALVGLVVVVLAQVIVKFVLTKTA